LGTGMIGAAGAGVGLALGSGLGGRSWGGDPHSPTSQEWRRGRLLGDGPPPFGGPRPQPGAATLLHGSRPPRWGRSRWIG
jgi:hypothetical protein